MVDQRPSRTPHVQLFASVGLDDAEQSRISKQAVGIADVIDGRDRILAGR